MLPVDDDENIISLGEGWTPLLHAPRLGKRVGIHELYIKDESQNPTQSFKARGMAAAVSMAKELGATKLAVPPQEMQPAHWLLTRRAPGSSRSSSCRATRREQTLSSVNKPART